MWGATTAAQIAGGAGADSVIIDLPLNEDNYNETNHAAQWQTAKELRFGKNKLDFVGDMLPNTEKSATNKVKICCS